MYKEINSSKETLSLIVLFILGTSTLQSMGLEAGQDLWLAIILATIMMIPLIYVFSRLYNIFQGKNLFEIIEMSFGKTLGKIINILFIWYVFYAGASVLRNYFQFVTITSLTNTPNIIIMISVMILSGWAVKTGIEVMGRLAKFFLILLMGLGSITTILIIPEMNFDNIKPVLENGIEPIVRGTFTVFSFPLGELIVFTMIFTINKRKMGSFKTYLTGLLVGSGLLIAIGVTNILVLGVRETKISYYPSYESIARLKIKDFIHGLEIAASMLFSIGAIAKTSIYLLATCKGVQSIFEFKGYRFLVTPISLLIVNLSYFMHDNMVEYLEWNKNIWKYYALPFQVFFPIIIFIAANIRGKQETSKKNKGT